jgi:glycosyltransferase involved in cell wall biosynthesis
MSARPRVAFVVERALGHATHADNLQQVISLDERVEAAWCPIPYDVNGFGARVPFYRSRWTLRAGLRARAAIRAAHRSKPLDALFIHTQVPAILAMRWMTKVPTVVSLDATPRQYDAFGTFYDHERENAFIEGIKFRANVRCFQRAAAIVTWSTWAKSGLVADYKVPDDKVFVIPPGVWFDQWARPTESLGDDSAVRILFVGADFDRKGGPILLDAFRRLRSAQPDAAAIELHIVTKATIPAEPGVSVHTGMTPNSPELLALYHRSHIFCLPTRADTLALVLSEAGAAGLALVSTAVGGIPELVHDGETGLLVPPDDVAALTQALASLVDQPDLRRRLAANATAAVRADFDARKNATRLVDVLQRVARRP